MGRINSPSLGVTPLFMQALAGEPEINYSAKEFRALTRIIWPTDGILGGTSFHVTQAETVGWSIRISSGVATLGGYLVTLPEAITMSLTGINTNPIATQHNAVFLVVQDKTVTGDGYYANIVVVTDEGAGWSGQLPDGAATLLLAVVAVSPGQTNIQDAHISAKPANASHGFAFVDLAAGGHLAAGIISAHTVYSEVGAARARYGAGTVTLTGGLRRTGSAMFDETTYNIGTLPYWMWPNTKRWLTGVAGGAAVPYRLSIDTDGIMRAQITAGLTTTLFLDGMSYEVD